MLQFASVAEELEKHELEVTNKIVILKSMNVILLIYYFNSREQMGKSWLICTVNYYVFTFATLTCKISLLNIFFCQNPWIVRNECLVVTEIQRLVKISSKLFPFICPYFTFFFF